jgi:hypothetical protein
VNSGSGGGGGQDAGWGGGLTVYNDDDGSNGAGESNSERLGKSMINALTIVGTICVATFLVVLLYKFRCMKVQHNELLSLVPLRAVASHVK